ncbi:uncharacterized protein LOC143933658 [Lithobates pipiens]
MFAGNANQVNMALPSIQVPPSTPARMVPPTAPMQGPVASEKNLPLPVMQAPYSTPIQMMPATVPMQVPVSATVPTQTATHLFAHPAVTMQPQPQTSVVLNMQGGAPMQNYMGPRGGPMAFGPISWGTGLLQCCDDIPICLLGCCCSCIFPCYLSSLFGEGCCFGMLPGAMCLLRTGVRERYRIPGSLFNDYCTVCCCLACALCQMGREIKGRDWHRRRFPMPWRMEDAVPL